MGLRVIALVEVLLLLAAIIVMDLLTGHGNRFIHINPHPFWIPVLLVAGQYGALEGLVAAICASAALLIGNLPPIGFGEDPYTYVVGLAINPAMWLAGGLAIGELRSQADRRAHELETELQTSLARENRLIAAAERLATANRALEERVAGQLRTVASLYEASRAVEQLGTGDVLVGIAGLVRAGLNPKKFSLFLLNQDQLESVINEGWTSNDKYTRIFGPTSSVYREVVVNRRHLCVTSAADQAVLLGEGILAGPITSAETGQTLGMLKVERMDAIDFNMTAVESFRVLCQWIGTSFARARTFEHAASRSFVGAGGILSASAEPPLTQFLKALARRAKFELSAINVSVHVPDSLPPECRSDVIRAIRNALSNGLRQTDIACERGGHGLDYVILAPVCPHNEARRLSENLRVAITQSLPQGFPIRVSTIAVPLLEKQILEATA
jgi:hypothetical protein